MSALVQHTIKDLRAGRESWRVMLLVTIPAFTIASATALLQLS